MAELVENLREAAIGHLEVLRAEGRTPDPEGRKGTALNIVLMHYPAWADDLRQSYDVLLAGHTHGGQVRAPFYGAFVTPQDSGPYQKGWYDTRGGRLYVNPGLGNFYADVRFKCRPEITVFEL